MKDNELIHFHDYFVFILDFFFFIFNHKSSIILQENLFNSKRIKMFKVYRSRNIMHRFFLVENLIERIKSKIKILYILNMIFKTMIETLKNFSIYLNIFSYFAALQFSN